MKQILILLFVILLFNNSHAQFYKYTVDVNISGRVDTVYNQDKRDIYHLFKNYLEARPDSFYNNPFWTNKDKYGPDTACIAEFYKGFSSLQTPPKNLFKQWSPYILTIEPANKNKYLLRVALVQDSMNGPDKFLTTLDVNAIRENGKWVLANTFEDVVNSWEKRQYKFIQYVYPPGYQFNEELAQKSVRFCDSISTLLQIPPVDSFTFYISDKPDQMGLLFGYEFYYANYTTGMTDLSHKRIYSAKGNEFYPHEFVHMITLKGPKGGNLNYLLQEGLCCFLGELHTKKYEDWFYYLAEDYLANKPTYTLHHLFTNTAEYNGYSTAYSTGSVLVEIIFDKAGYEGIRKLLRARADTEEEIYKTMQDITGLNKVQLEKAFRAKLVEKTKPANSAKK